MIDRKIELPDGVPPLNSYYVYMTSGCNLACRHCWISPTYQPHGGTGGHLDYELFSLAIDEGIPLGLANVKLTGGEPLLHPDFTRMVDLLREKNIKLTIETNGTLMTSSLARYLQEKSSLQFISVSLDGALPETHDTFRGVEGSFEKACQGIRYLVEVGYRPQVIMSLHVDNIKEMEAVVQLSEELGAGSVKFNLVQPSGRGKQMDERSQVNELSTLIQLGHWVEDELEKKVTIPLTYSWPMAFFNIHHLLNFQGYSCNIHNILGILPSGHLALCGIGTQIPELCYGKIGEDRISSIWEKHPILCIIRESLPEKLEGICGACVFRDSCLGLCMAENYFLSKTITAPGWFCHEADRLGYFPKTRKILK